MAINLRREIKPYKAEVSDEFIKVLREEVFMPRLRAARDKINRNARWAAKDTMIQEYAILKKMAALLRDDTELDRMIATMRRLPYVEFGVSMHNSKKYIHGLTEPVIMECFNGYSYEPDKVQCKYNIGEYRVVFAVDDLVRGNQNTHLIPEKSPKAVYRTPHHHAEPKHVHPLDRPTRTCVGSFQSLLMAPMAECNVAELFRVWRIYLSRCNLESQYRTLGETHYVNPLDLMTWKELV